MTTMQPRTENKVTRSHPMHCDVIEFEDRYELNLDLPGFQKEEIRISVEDSNLTVEAAHSAQENTGKMLRNERYTGPYARSFHIGKVRHLSAFGHGSASSFRQLTGASDDSVTSRISLIL